MKVTWDQVAEARVAIADLTRRQHQWVRTTDYLAIGPKSVNGVVTTDLSLHAVVTEKLPKSGITRRDRIPSTIAGLPTDVVAAGDIPMPQAPTPHQVQNVGYGTGLIRSDNTIASMGCIVRDARRREMGTTAAHFLGDSPPNNECWYQRAGSNSYPQSSDFELEDCWWIVPTSTVYGERAHSLHASLVRLDIARLRMNQSVVPSYSGVGGASLVLHRSTGHLKTHLLEKPVQYVSNVSRALTYGTVWELFPQSQQAPYPLYFCSVSTHGGLEGDSGALWCYPTDRGQVIVGQQSATKFFKTGPNLALLSDFTTLAIRNGWNTDWQWKQ